MNTDAGEMRIEHTFNSDTIEKAIKDKDGSQARAMATAVALRHQAQASIGWMLSAAH